MRYLKKTQIIRIKWSICSTVLLVIELIVWNFGKCVCVCVCVLVCVCVCVVPEHWRKKRKEKGNDAH